MSKKHFIALEELIIGASKGPRLDAVFSEEQIRLLADWCERENGNFNWARWIAFIAQKCGPNGGRK